MVQIAVFFVFVLGVVVGVHYYLWRRLVKDTTAPGRGRRVGTALAVALALLIPTTLIMTRVSTGLHALAMVGYLWLAVMFYLLVSLAVLEVPRALLRWRRTPAKISATAVPAASPATAPAHAADGPDLTTATPKTATATAQATAPTGEPTAPGTATSEEPATAEAATAGKPASPDDGPELTRRRLISRGIAITAGLVAVGTTGYGMTQALGAPRIKRVPVTLAKLPRAMDGYRVALVSDIHLGPLAGRDHTQRIVDIINKLDADIVTIVGDLVDGTVAQLGPAAEPLRGLRSREGAYFVTGNHEYYSGFEEWVVEVGELGVRPLRNERVELSGGLDLAGVNDVTGDQYGDGADLGKALADRDTAKPVILLAHQPIQVRDAAEHGVDLQLSGHTHGGQLAPFNLLVPLQQPVVSGYDVIDGTQIYVTNGAGFWGPPVRVGAPPEITLMELRSK